MIFKKNYKAMKMIRKIVVAIFLGIAQMSLGMKPAVEPAVEADVARLRSNNEALSTETARLDAWNKRYLELEETLQRRRAQESEFEQKLEAAQKLAESEQYRPKYEQYLRARTNLMEKEIELDAIKNDPSMQKEVTLESEIQSLKAVDVGLTPEVRAQLDLVVERDLHQNVRAKATEQRMKVANIQIAIQGLQQQPHVVNVASEQAAQQIAAGLARATQTSTGPQQQQLNRAASTAVTAAQHYERVAGFIESLIAKFRAAGESAMRSLRSAVYTARENISFKLAQLETSLTIWNKKLKSEQQTLDRAVFDFNNTAMKEMIEFIKQEKFKATDKPTLENLDRALAELEEFRSDIKDPRKRATLMQGGELFNESKKIFVEETEGFKKIQTLEQAFNDRIRPQHDKVVEAKEGREVTEAVRQTTQLALSAVNNFDAALSQEPQPTLEVQPWEAFGSS